MEFEAVLFFSWHSYVLRHISEAQSGSVLGLEVEVDDLLS